MNSRELRNRIFIKRPRYQDSKRELLDLLAKKGGKKGEFLLFGPYYEIYMYAFFLGYHRNERLPLSDSSKKEQFRDFGQWKPQGIVDYILMLLLSDQDIIKYQWDELEELEEDKIEEAVSMIITAVEEYANAGLSFLSEKIETEQHEFTDPFVFVNLLNEVIDKKKEKESYSKSKSVSKKLIAQTKEQLRIKSLIEDGESSTVEFKSTLRVNLHTYKPDPKIEHSCLKTIAGFMNSNGGILLIGISGSKEVLGLENDFNSFSNKSDLLDEFQKYLDNLIENYLGNSAYSSLTFSFPVIDGKVICCIDIEHKSNGPIYLKNKAQGNSEEFYIRRAASTKALKPSEIIAYKENHWG